MEYCRIASDVIFGKNVKIYGFVNIYGCSIGDNTRIGSFVEIQKGASVGNNCKISSHTFICEGIVIGSNVFIGHNVTFINDRYPRAVNAEGSPQTGNDWLLEQTTVCEGVSIGSGSVILCGITIGPGAMVGAGSLVTTNIPANELWLGNPAHFIKKFD